VLIPPSIIFIIYGIITENSIGDLFAAGIIPGVLLSLLFVLTVYILVRIKPSLAPLGPKTDVRQKLGSVTGVAEALLLFALVMGGLFWGIFTPTEAAAVGAFLTIAIAVLRRNLSWSGFVASLYQTTKISCMVLVIVTGATIFGRFLVVTRLPFELAAWVGDLPLSPVIIMGIIVLMHLVGGFFMDSLAMILLTVPIFFPVVLALGFDPIWFGVIIVLVTEMGVITPPVGINVYVVNAVVREVPLESIFKGALPFLFAILLCTAMLLAFPDLALYLPRLLK
jgi:tripartite ATP-independent transporter DctM subunit